MNPGISRRWEVGLVVAAAAVVAGALLASGRFDVGVDTSVSILFEKNYHVGAPIYGGGKGEVLSGEWTRTLKGLQLQPGRSGQILIPLWRPAGEARVVVKIRGRGGLGLHAAVLVSGEGGAFRTIAQGNFSDGMRVEFAPAAGESERLWIKLAASVDAAAAPGESGTLTEIRIFSKGPFAFPNVALACLFVLTPLLAYVVWSKTRPALALLYSLGFLAGQTLLSGTLTWTDPVYLCGTTRYLWWLDPLIQNPRCEMYFTIPYGMLLGLLAWHVRIWHGSSEVRRQWAGFALLGVIAWGGSLRIEQLVQVSGLSLESDVNFYWLLADAMRSPYDTAWREPLWIWMVKGLMWVGGGSIVSLRLLTVALSLLVIYSAYKLFSDYTRQPFVGLVVALLLSLNPYLIRMSVRGMKEETYMVLVLWFVHLAFVRKEQGSVAWRSVGLALSGAGLLLVRLNSWVFVAPLLLLWAWRQARGQDRRWGLRLACITAFIGMAIAPHLVHNDQMYGDPFFSVNHHAAWGRNFEFLIVKGGGCTGCPTVEEMEQDSYAGPRLTTYDYFFKLHSLREVRERLFTGYTEMYLIPTDHFKVQAGTDHLLVYLVYCLGLVLALRGPHRAMLAVVVLLINGIPLLMTLAHEPRVGIHTAPFVAFVLALGLWQCVKWSGLLCMTLKARAGALAGPLSRRLLSDVGRDEHRT
ncbi:MAG: hypothetical protein Q7R68_04375 [Nitrospirales bacterium]|nr:hypothetical protein [Nitrospirales bacterium]